jgi:hypothetical protein
MNGTTLRLHGSVHKRATLTFVRVPKYANNSALDCSDNAPLLITWTADRWDKAHVGIITTEVGRLSFSEVSKESQNTNLN